MLALEVDELEVDAKRAGRFFGGACRGVPEHLARLPRVDERHRHRPGGREHGGEQQNDHQAQDRAHSGLVFSGTVPRQWAAQKRLNPGVSAGLRILLE